MLTMLRLSDRRVQLLSLYTVRNVHQCKEGKGVGCHIRKVVINATL